MQTLSAAILLLATGCAAVGEVQNGGVQSGDGTDRRHGSFFNRPGVDERELARDLEQCRAITTGVGNAAVDHRMLAPANPKTAAPIVGNAARSTIEDCMVSRGWNVFALSAQESIWWSGLSPNRQAAETAMLASARKPSRGRLIREGSDLLLRDPAQKRIRR